MPDLPRWSKLPNAHRFPQLLPAPDSLVPRCSGHNLIDWGEGHSPDTALVAPQCRAAPSQTGRQVFESEQELMGSKARPEPSAQLGAAANFLLCNAKRGTSQHLPSLPGKEQWGCWRCCQHPGHYCCCCCLLLPAHLSTRLGIFHTLTVLSWEPVQMRASLGDTARAAGRTPPPPQRMPAGVSSQCMDPGAAGQPGGLYCYLTANPWLGCSCREKRPIPPLPVGC